MTDPMESIIAGALQDIGAEYYLDGESPNQTGLDFYLPAFGIYIEVKQFHSKRITEQTARVENVIVAQGFTAVNQLAAWIRGTGK